MLVIININVCVYVSETTFRKLFLKVWEAGNIHNN